MTDRTHEVEFHNVFLFRLVWIKKGKPKIEIFLAEGKSCKCLAYTMEAPKLLQIHPGCRIMVKFTLNTPVKGFSVGLVTSHVHHKSTNMAGLM
jgi:hypothetical protein